MTIKKVINIEIPENLGGGYPNSQFFFRNPQYVVKAIPSSALVTHTPIRVSYEGPYGSSVCTILTKTGNTKRVLCLTPDIQVINSPDALNYKRHFSCIEYMLPCKEFFILIFSTKIHTMIGKFKITFESQIPLEINPIEPEGFNMKPIEIAVNII